MNGNDRAIVSLVTVAHAMVHTYELSIPVLVTVWLDAFPVSTATMGLVTAAGYALFGIGALPGGILADALGSRRLIVAGLAGMAASFLALGAAPSVPALAVALVVWGAAASVYHPAGLALISTGVRERGTAFAYHGIAGNLGIALGPLAAVLLLSAFGWRTAVLALAVPAGIAAAYALGLDVEETAAVETREATDGGGRTGVDSLGAFLAESRALFAGGFAVVFAMVIGSGLYYRGVLTFLPDLLSAFPVFRPVEVGGRTLEPGRYAYSGLLIVGVLGQYAGGKLTDRIETTGGLAAGYGALAVVALVFLPLARSGLAGFLVAGAALGILLFLVQPLMQATVAEYTPAGTRGLSYGYTYLGVFGVGALGAAVAGGLLGYFSPGVLFLALAGFAATASGLGLYLYR
ncbi:MAG: MFS transporter [Halobacteriales archaeon]